MARVIPPWISSTERAEAENVAQATDGKAPIRIFDAWAQLKLNESKSDGWDEVAHVQQLSLWEQFFNALGTQSHDVELFESTCASLGGLGTFKNAYDRGGFFAMHVCAAQGFTDVMTLLLQHGFNAEVPSVHDENIGLWDEVSDVITSGIRPLHLAAKYGHTNVITLLLDHGVDVNATAATCQGELTRPVNSIQLAAVEGHVPAALLLLEHGGDVSSDSCYGKAESCGGPKFARALMDKGFPIKVWSALYRS